MEQPLNRADSLTFVERLADLMRGEYPLVQGLRLAALEPSSRQLQKALNELAEALEAGIPWSELSQLPHHPIPPHVLGALQVGVEEQRIVDMLDQLVQWERSRRELVTRAMRAMAYPTIIVLLAIVLITIQSVWVVPALSLDGLGDVSLDTQQFKSMQWSRQYASFLVAMGVGVFVITFLLRVGLGRVGFTHLFHRIPFVGRLWHWIGTLEWLQLVRTLMKSQIPLAQILRMVAPGVHNPAMNSFSSWLADRFDQGYTFSAAIQSTDRIPSELKPLMIWGEEQQCLPDALDACCEVLQDRIDSRIAFAREIVGPLAFVCVVIAISVFVVGLQFGFNLLRLFGHCHFWLS